MHDSVKLGITKRSGPDEELSDGWREGAYSSVERTWSMNGGEKPTIEI